VARIAKEHFPGLRLHASTQMAVHNLAGVKEAIKYGFKQWREAASIKLVDIIS
jgi:putative protease